MINQILHAPDLNEFEKYLSHADNQTLVVFDIDEVIFTSKDQVLNPNYKSYRDVLEKKLAEQVDADKQKKLNFLLYKLRPRVIVDPNILRIFDFLLRKNIKTIALTHCPTGMIGGDNFEILRVAQLKNFGIDFSKLLPHVIDVDLSTISTDIGTPQFLNGVILTGKIEKGIVLREFLRKIAFKPKQILFIDDRIENLLSVQSMCADLEIEYVGFEYTAVADTLPIPFDEERANLQFQILMQESIWLSDEQIKDRLETK
ncbi:MAG: DUF2608 domain-containing protein [Janthinobacterium lividum]